MLQGLLSPSMELLSSVDNNLGASHLWSLANQPDSHYQAAAMEAILTQASLGLISEHQAGLVNYHGMLNHPSFIEGMDETQFIPQSSASANPGLSSNSATTASSSLGLDQKLPTDDKRLSSKPSNLMLSFSSHDLPRGQAGMCAAKRRSWQEALCSPSRANHYNLSIVDPNERGVSPPAPHILYSVTDPKVSIASLAYPCTIVEPTHESGNPSYIENTSMGMGAYIDPVINTRANLMQEGMHTAGMCPDDDHGTCMGHAANKDIRGSSHTGMLSSGSHETKEAIGTHEYINFTHGSSFNGINSDDNSAPLSLYKEEPFHEADGKERDIGMALSSREPIPLGDHVSRKRLAAVAHLPCSSAAYSKRAHLQSKPMAMTCTTTTSSTTTRSSKSSSRNPQGPALNTNGKPRAMQGSASDPQSLAARNRRERINARLKVLQELVPNGSKVDLVTMLEKAINYVKFLQLQLRVLSNDEYWQANKENGEQATTNLEKEYTTHLNAACESLIACSDNIGGNQCSYV